MSTETTALSAVENEASATKLTLCRKIICSVEKGDVHLAARLFETLRRMLRAVSKNKQASADEKLDAIALLARLKKANRDPDQDGDASSASTGATANTTDSHPIDWFDIVRAIGWQYDKYREPLKRSDRDAMLTELLGAEPTVVSVQRLILDLRRPEPGGTRLMNLPIVFTAAKEFLADHGASELPREAADLAYDLNNKSFEERMRERGAEGF